MRRHARSGRLLVAGYALALLSLPAPGSAPAQDPASGGAKPAKENGFIDVHIHLSAAADRGGRTEGGGDRGEAAQALLDQMARYGVAKALVMPPPRTVENVDRNEFAGLAAVVKRHPGRLFLAGGGDVLNAMIHETQASTVTPEIRARFEKEAGRLVDSGVKAFGEIAALHLSFDTKHVYEATQPDHPLFLLLADLSARHAIPMDLHMEAVPADMPTPPALRRLSPNNPDTLQANIPALERLLGHNREARVVWQHIGWDNTGGMTLDLLRRLLTAHSNLFLALRVEERTRSADGSPMRNRIVDTKGKIQVEWRRFFEEFPERCVIGTDEFFLPAGSKFMGRKKESPQSFEETWRILDQLAPDLAAKIGRENARRIYRLQ